jgi:uncharacterized repeat protein (TIGR03803 family)
LKAPTRSLADSLSLLMVALLVACGSQSPEGVPAASPQERAIERPEQSPYRVLYRFNHPRDGYQPTTQLMEVDRALYGTTASGGSASGCGYSLGCGTIYRINPHGGEKVLHSFAGPPDGARAFGNLIDVKGTLYGVTTFGGTSKGGTVYTLSTTGQESVLFSFRMQYCTCYYPAAGVLYANRRLYGTTEGGGTGNGTVFSLTLKRRAQRLHEFRGGSDGAVPGRGTLIDVNGMLYGTTIGGGSTRGCSGCGTVYSISPSGSETVLHSFSGGADGANPNSGLIDVNGTLYGTTESGGGTACEGNGCGTIYSITTSGQETVLYSFRGGTDGVDPISGVIDVNGTLYGTTAWGGSKNCRGAGCGTVYSLSLSGAEQVLHSFAGGDDGAEPIAELVDVNGTLYGTTSANRRVRGNGAGPGTIFALTLASGGDIR